VFIAEDVRDIVDSQWPGNSFYADRSDLGREVTLRVDRTRVLDAARLQQCSPTAACASTGRHSEGVRSVTASTRCDPRSGCANRPLLPGAARADLKPAGCHTSVQTGAVTPESDGCWPTWPSSSATPAAVPSSISAPPASSFSHSVVRFLYRRAVARVLDPLMAGRRPARDRDRGDGTTGLGSDHDGRHAALL
jgi:hypothetical protein